MENINLRRKSKIKFRILVVLKFHRFLYGPLFNTRFDAVYYKLSIHTKPFFTSQRSLQRTRQSTRQTRFVNKVKFSSSYPLSWISAFVYPSPGLLIQIAERKGWDMLKR